MPSPDSEEFERLKEVLTSVNMGDPGADTRLKDEQVEQRLLERAEQIRRDNLTRFQPHQGPARLNTKICPFCSAVVADPVRHLDWHDSMNAADQQGQLAYNRTQIIG